MEGEHLMRKNGAGAQEVWWPWLSTRDVPVLCQDSSILPFAISHLGASQGSLELQTMTTLKKHLKRGSSTAARSLKVSTV